MSVMAVMRGILGIALILGVAFLFSNNKRKISWRLVGFGLLFQLVFAVFIIHGETFRSWFFMLGWPKDMVTWLGGAFVKLLEFITEGSKFVFGNLAIAPGMQDSMGFYFAFQVLPTIVFFASLTAVLYYLGILQLVVKGMAYVMARLLGTSGAESLSNTANIFVGQTEAPILIRPYLRRRDAHLHSNAGSGLCGGAKYQPQPGANPLRGSSDHRLCNGGAGVVGGV